MMGHFGPGNMSHYESVNKGVLGVMKKVYNRIWSEIAGEIRPHLSADAFQRWFAGIELVRADESAITLQVPNSIYQFWIESNYLSVVDCAVRTVLGSTRSINFHSPEGPVPGLPAAECASIRDIYCPLPRPSRWIRQGQLVSRMRISPTA